MKKKKKIKKFYNKLQILSMSMSTATQDSRCPYDDFLPEGLHWKIIKRFIAKLIRLKNLRLNCLQYNKFRTFFYNFPGIAPSDVYIPMP